MKEIILTNGGVCLVDDEDFEYLNSFKWGRMLKGDYAKKWRCKRLVDKSSSDVVLMHRLIMGVTDKRNVDHVDGNRLNNQKYNLRICSYMENSRNQKVRKNNMTGYKGVMLERGRWRARIRYGGKNLHLGVFETAKEAAEAYNKAATSLFKGFARLNIIK